MTALFALVFIGADLFFCTWLLVTVYRITHRAGGRWVGRERALAVWCAAGGVAAKLVLAMADAAGGFLVRSDPDVAAWLAAEHASSALLALTVLLLVWSGFRAEDTGRARRSDLLRNVRREGNGG